jgi:hypothetical protein
MYFVIFNGPPRVGKDTLSRMLLDHMDSRIKAPAIEESLSKPMRGAMFGLLGLNYSDELYESLKPCMIPSLRVSGRQHMIDISEKFLKPVYGQDIMARLLLDRVHDFPGLVLIRDGGFQIEVDEIIRFAGERNVYIVRVHRNNCDFRNDSREWIHHPLSSCEMGVPNTGTLEDLRVEAGRIYGRLVNQMGWKL